MASHAASDGGGGAGGKFRTRPFRRSAATPYDRPPSALRGAARTPAEGAAAGGWLSKLVDPASRAITSGASRLLSSVFGRRLPPALPSAAVPEASPRFSEVQEVLAQEVVANNLSSDVREQEGSAGDKAMNNSESGGISDLEQILKQKTFTRVEFDHLMELLHSRTMESGSSEPAVNYKDKENTSALMQENGTGSSRLYGNVPNHERLLSDAASPAEIAKAYMGSRPSKVSPSSLCLRSQVLQEETIFQRSAPYAAKTSDFSLPPRSIVQSSGISEPPENCHATPRTQGRSAISKMSRSPFFKAQSTSNIKGGLPVWSGPSSSSQWTPTTVANSGGKQVLKRQSLVLGNDIGSSGPIRRIRHKPNLITPMKGMQSSISGNLLSNLPTSHSKYGIHGSTSSIQKPVLFDVQKYGTTVLQDGGNGDDKTSCATGLQSSEMERKILQQLDKLVPSPKGKSSEPKAILRNESSSKLTLNMLHGPALRSMEHIDPSKFLNAQSVSQEQEKIKENGRMVLSGSGVNMASEAVGSKNVVTSGQASKSVTRTTDVLISGSGVVSQNEPASQINVLEGLLKMDNDGSKIKDVSGPSTTFHDNVESEVLDSKSDIFESTFKKSQVHSDKSLPASTPMLQKEVYKKATDGPVLAEKVDFSFPFVPATSDSQPPPPTPTMPTQLSERSALQEQPAAPLFTFGSKAFPTLKFSSTLSGVGVSAGLKFGLSNSLTAALPKSINSVKGDATQKAIDVPQSMENAVLLGKSTSTTPPLFQFGASTTSSLSNGSFKSTSAVFSASTAPFKRSSDTPTDATFSLSTTAATSSGSLSLSSSAPVPPTFPALQFGSGSSAGASIPVLPTLDKSDSKDLEEKPVRALPFSFSSSSSIGTSAVMSTGSSSSNLNSCSFLSTGSASFGVATSSTFSSLDNASSGLATSYLSSSSANGSSSLPMPSVLSGASTGSPDLAKSSLFTSNSYAPAVPSLISGTGTGYSSLAFSSSSSSSLTSAGTGIFSSSASKHSSSSALLFGNSTQTTTFGSAVGSVPGNCMSSFSWNTGQISSFSSTPTFGLGTSSSSFVFGSSGFASSAPFGNSPSSSSVICSSDGPSSSSSTNSSFVQAAVPSLFSSSSWPSTSSVFGSTYGASTSLQSTGFPFGSSAPSGSSPTFGSSSGLPTFGSSLPFTSCNASTTSSFSSLAPPIFGMSTPATGICSGSQKSDQMNVEDSMAYDKATVPTVPMFGHSVNSPAMSNLIFSSPGQATFQFGSDQNSSIPQNSSLFQTGGSLELPPGGGNFSLGSGGADKSGRRIVKVKRDKHRKK